MTNKVTTVNHLAIRMDGAIHALLAYGLDDGTVCGGGPEAIVPGDLDAQIAAINARLPTLGWPAVDDAQWASLRAVTAALWTPELIAAYQAAHGGDDNG